MAEVILAVLVLGPAVIAYLLKSNGALSFLALCASFAAVSFASSDLKNLTGQLNFSVNNSTINLVLLGLPLLLTLLLTRHSFSGGFAGIVHLATALCAGGLLALVAIPLLAGSVRTDLVKLTLWSDLRNVQAEVVGAGVVLSLFTIWSAGFKKSSGKSKHKK